jgi:hypothetical protein
MTMIDARRLAIRTKSIFQPLSQSAGGSHEHHPRSASRHPRRRSLGAAREHHHVVGR